MIKTKKIASIMLVFFIFMFSFPYQAFAGKYTSTGLLTTGMDVDDSVSCTESLGKMTEWEKNFAENNKNIGELPKESESESNNKFLQIVSSPVYNSLEDTFGSEPGNDPKTKGIIKGDCTEEFSVTKHILKITSPVKLTEFKPFMTFMKHIQNISLGCIVFFIVLYGFQYTLGKKELEDPIKFSYRMGFVIFGITFAPRIIQDLLNINNIIVYYISTLPIPGTALGGATAGGAFLGLAGSMAIANFLAMTVASVASGVGLFVLILIVILLLMILIPLIKILTWWYIRLFTILLMSVFSPIFIMMFASESSSKMAKKFFLTLVAEIFSQVFVTIGFYFSVMLLLNYDQLSSTFDLGIIGLMLFLYVQIQLLSELPEVTKKWIGGGATLSYKQISGALAGGIGAAIGSGFDKSLKKFGEKTAQNKFNKDKNAQHGAVSSAMANQNSWDAMNDPNGSQNNKMSPIEKIKNNLQQSGDQQAGAGRRQTGAVGVNMQTPARKNAQQLVSNNASGGGQGTNQTNVNQDALKQSMNDNIAFGLQAQEMEHYSDGVKQKLIEGAKNGTLSANDAKNLMVQDLLRKGENSLAAEMQAGQDFNQIQNTYGVKFGEKNNNVKTGNEMKLATPIEGVTNPYNQQPKGIFTDNTMSQIQGGLQEGTMHRSEAVNLMKNDLMANRGMGDKQASQLAEARMQAFEKSSPTGLGFEAQSQINKLAKNGDLTQNNVRDIARRDAVYNKGLNDKGDIQKHIDNVMAKGNFEEKVGQKSIRDTAQVKKTPGLNLGNGIRTQGGIKEGARATTGERVGINYEIPSGTPQQSKKQEINSLEKIVEKHDTQTPITKEEIHQQQDIDKQKEMDVAQNELLRPKPNKQKEDGTDPNPKSNRNVVDNAVVGANSHIAKNEREISIEQSVDSKHNTLGGELNVNNNTENTEIHKENDKTTDSSSQVETHQNPIESIQRKEHTASLQDEEPNEKNLQHLYDKYSSVINESDLKSNDSKTTSTHDNSSTINEEPASYESRTSTNSSDENASSTNETLYTTIEPIQNLHSSHEMNSSINSTEPSSIDSRTDSGPRHDSTSIINEESIPYEHRTNSTRDNSLTTNENRVSVEPISDLNSGYEKERTPFVPSSYTDSTYDKESIPIEREHTTTESGSNLSSVYDNSPRTNESKYASIEPGSNVNSSYENSSATNETKHTSVDPITDFSSGFETERGSIEPNSYTNSRYDSATTEPERTMVEPSSNVSSGYEYSSRVNEPESTTIDSSTYSSSRYDNDSTSIETERTSIEPITNLSSGYEMEHTPIEPSSFESSRYDDTPTTIKTEHTNVEASSNSRSRYDSEPTTNKTERTNIEPKTNSTSENNTNSKNTERRTKKEFEHNQNYSDKPNNNTPSKSSNTRAEQRRLKRKKK